MPNKPIRRCIAITEFIPCLKCGKPLYRLGMLIPTRRSVSYAVFEDIEIENDGLDSFLRCKYCDAKNIVMYDLEENIPMFKISHIKEKIV